MKVLSHEEMRAADRAAIAAGVPELVLMENAAYGVLRAMEARYGALGGERIAIFCGKGNNGGDGLALARLIALHHRPVRLDVLLAFAPEELGPMAAAQLKMLEALGIAYTMQWPADLAATTLAVDALLGTGVQGEPRSPVKEAIECLNGLPLARRVAVDIPSALRVRADLTVTFAAPKPEHVLTDAVGEWVVAPIGIPEAVLAGARWNVTTAADLKAFGVARARGAHKGTYGHVAVLGGAEGKPGALQLAGEAALRGGAGLVTLHSPDAAFRPHLPDLMYGPWPAAVAELERYRVVAVGPGLGLCRDFLAALYHEYPGPLVVDADGLNSLAPLAEPARCGAPRYLTPHPGEMARLLGRAVEDRVADALSLAAITGATVILKGQRTLVALADGTLWVNPTGSPALAKAGSGDVLTGLLAALLAQFPEQGAMAAVAAVYVHGRCGELAARAVGERSSLASGLAQYLGEAFGELGG